LLVQRCVSEASHLVVARIKMKHREAPMRVPNARMNEVQIAPKTMSAFRSGACECLKFILRAVRCLLLLEMMTLLSWDIVLCFDVTVKAKFCFSTTCTL
jgi:hypothetical protein